MFARELGIGIDLRKELRSRDAGHRQRLTRARLLEHRREFNADTQLVQELLKRHIRYTESTLAARILTDWSLASKMFVKVMPRDYKRALVELTAVTVSSGGDGFLTTESEGLG